MTGPEVLAVAPRPVDRRLLRVLVAVALVGLLALAGTVVWRRLQPPPDFTLGQLQDAYAGMVRSDGTNDVSVITPGAFPSDTPVRVTPAACTPLFATTVVNQFPSPALDGVSTYWFDPGSATVSLFTVRYVDDAAAERAYAEVGDAVSACDGRTVRFSRGEGPGRLRPVAVNRSRQDPEQLAYQLERPVGEGRYALHLLRLQNTVTWQYRYDARDTPYDPTPAEQLMDGLVRQLHAVQRAGS